MSYSGTWDITLHSPVGAQKMSFAAKAAGEELTGVVTGANGEVTEITKGKVEGAVATWDMAVTKPMALTLSFTANLDGDTISGTTKLGMFGNAKFEGTRVS
jgi:hypothetical protein